MTTSVPAAESLQQFLAQVAGIKESFPDLDGLARELAGGPLPGAVDWITY